MVVLIISLLIGIIVFFIGLSLLVIHKKGEEEKVSIQVDEEINARKELSEEEIESISEAPSKSYIFALMLGGEGLLLSVLSITAMLINSMLAKIPIYISIPIILVYLAGCFVINALKMYKE